MLQIVLLGALRGIFELPFIISSLAPAILNRNWMALQNDATKLRRNSSPSISPPTEQQMDEGWWLFAYQDYSVQLYTLLVAWFALLYSVFLFSADALERHGWSEFIAFISEMHWSVHYFGVSFPVIVVSGFVFLMGALISGYLSKHSIVQQYRYEENARMLFRYHVPKLRNPITIGRISVALLAILFRIWQDILSNDVRWSQWLEG